MRRLVTALCLAAASCGDEPGASEVQRYLTDRAFRRAELVASLTTTDNDYARLRLARYDSADARDWSLRPVWNPPAAPLVPAATPLRPLDLPASTDRASLLSLGEAAFSRYPAMLASTTVEATLRAPGAAARYGFWTSADGHVGGLVRVALADGTVGLAYSCATCHRAPDAEGNAVPGLANGALDLGALGADSNPTIPPAEEGRLRRWGPGRVDVTTDDGREPIAIPDLRAVREQSHLQRSGAVRRRSLSALAIRIETLLITSHHEAVRPPREVALGLALYLDSLADSLPAPRVDHPAPRSSPLAAGDATRLPPGAAGSSPQRRSAPIPPSPAHPRGAPGPIGFLRCGASGRGGGCSTTAPSRASTRCSTPRGCATTTREPEGSEPYLDTYSASIFRPPSARRCGPSSRRCDPRHGDGERARPGGVHWRATPMAKLLSS